MKDFKKILSETIRKTGDEYTILSKKGKKLGKYDSKEAAVKRLKQIEWFGHLTSGKTHQDFFAGRVTSYAKSTADWSDL